MKFFPLVAQEGRKMSLVFFVAWFTMCGESPLIENKDRAWWARSSRTSMNCLNSLPKIALFC